MLGKLIKYEFKATGRTFLPLYGMILVISLIQRLLGQENGGLFTELNQLGDFTTLILVALFIALVVLTLVVTIQRFQKNLLADEGYLMFTLPVSTRSLIFSKMIVAITWVIISVLIGAVAFFILLTDRIFFAQLENILSQIKININIGEIVMAIQILVSGLLGYFQFLLTIYLSLSVSQFPKFQKYRGAIAIIAFILINTVIGWAGGILMNQATFITVNSHSNIILLMANILTAVIGVGLFEATNYILKRHLNLE